MHSMCSNCPWCRHCQTCVLHALQAIPADDNLANLANNVAAIYGISAAALNLDPRQLATVALQPLWDNNQKLELLRVACEVGFLRLLLGTETSVQQLASWHTLPVS